MADEIGKKIAMRLHNGFGGHTRVMQYRNETNVKFIDVLRYETPAGDYIGTIGGYRYPRLGSDTRPDGTDIRVELVALVEHQYASAMESAISSVYFEVDNHSVRLYPGAVVKDILPQYDDKALPHLYFTNPIFEGDFSSMDCGGYMLAFLWAFPISQKELEYLVANGMEKFEEELEESRFNYQDIHRPSIM